jgi:hypothetical protein
MTWREYPGTEEVNGQAIEPDRHQQGRKRVNCLAKSLNQRQLPPQRQARGHFASTTPCPLNLLQPRMVVRLANGLQHYLASPRRRNFRQVAFPDSQLDT